jgi:membrane-bound lytic murein transglycosylase A
MMAEPARARRASSLARAVIGVAALVAGAATGSAQAAKGDPLKIRDAQYEPASFAEVDGWANDDHAEAFATFLDSCRVLLRGRRGARDDRPFVGALRDICRKAMAAVPLDSAGAQKFFEDNFRPVRISPLGTPDGFITGYFEPIVDGARLPSHEYTVPLYRRPPNLLTSRLRFGGKKGKGKGARKKAAGFYDRAQIEDGAIAGRDLEICYLKDPIDAFFAHIQGSTRVRLEDGTVLRLNYDANNGHPYTAVGRILIERQIYTREEVTMQRIREWMEANPEEGKALRRENKSFIFFRETELSSYDEAIGAQGISLTAGRSIAVDRNLHVYGTPFFLDAVLPVASETADTRFARLMVAQDTGGAIVGPARADIYFGAGEEAGRVAGRLKHWGRFVMLVPRELDPVLVAKAVPLPPARPALKPEKGAAAAAPDKKEAASAKPDGKASVAKEDKAKATDGARGNARRAEAGVPLPPSNPSRRKK